MLRWRYILPFAVQRNTDRVLDEHLYRRQDPLPNISPSPTYRARKSVHSPPFGLIPFSLSVGTPEPPPRSATLSFSRITIL